MPVFLGALSPAPVRPGQTHEPSERPHTPWLQVQAADTDGEAAMPVADGEAAALLPGDGATDRSLGRQRACRLAARALPALLLLPLLALAAAAAARWQGHRPPLLRRAAAHVAVKAQVSAALPPAAWGPAATAQGYGAQPLRSLVAPAPVQVPADGTPGSVAAAAQGPGAQQPLAAFVPAPAGPRQQGPWQTDPWAAATIPAAAAGSEQAGPASAGPVFVLTHAPTTAPAVTSTSAAASSPPPADPAAARHQRGGAAAAAAGPGCEAAELPRLWSHADVSSHLKVRLLTYNLFWWNLFGVRKGNNASAAKLIVKSGHAQPYDFMGFQECMDPQRVLEDAGLAEQYAAFGGDGTGTSATCMAFRKASWTLLGHGFEYVAEDSHVQYFGKRAAQWMRLRHTESGMVVFFMNHHGPLPINSGGRCGGAATAHHLLQVAVKHAHRGDAVVLVGDFNADASSSTVRHLEQRLLRAYTGRALGGIDSVFSNVGKSSVAARANLGTGGSDHDALSVVLDLGGAPGTARPAAEDLRFLLAGTPRPGWSVA